MKRILSLLPVLLLVVLFNQEAVAQLSPSSEPRAVMTATGELIIMPVIHFQPEILPATSVSTKVAVEQKAPARTRKTWFTKRVNGYYAMNTNRNWGTSYRLSQY